MLSAYDMFVSYFVTSAHSVPGGGGGGGPITRTQVGYPPASINL